jgi:hypothetical protein
MKKFWVKIALLFSTLSWGTTQVLAASVFSYAQINVPFEVRVDGGWVQVIEDQATWEAFYVEHAEVYLGQDSELITPPELDFKTYTVIAAGLGAGSSGRSLMIEYVKGTSSTTYVSALILRTGGSCIITANVTYPTLVVLIPKPQETLKLFSKESVFECE